MPVLILYATTEGQTEKIARFAADHLQKAGQTVDLIPLAGTKTVDLARYDRVILMASVHAGRYQGVFCDFVTAQRTALAQLPTLFLSVSLSAASDDSEDLDGIAACVDKMIAETGWTPGEVRHVAGAFRFTQYDFLKSWAMRWIAAKKDPQAGQGGDTEYTDWDALCRLLDAWITVPARA
jgi:menaquinone-dependent protoporphyrinogen oxidase